MANMHSLKVKSVLDASTKNRGFQILKIYQTLLGTINILRAKWNLQSWKYTRKNW